MLRMPWVSRKALDQARQSATQAYDRLDIALGEIEKLTLYAEKANGRYESLVERMLAMKRSEGWHTAPIIQTPLKAAESAIEPQVEFAIENRASGDPFLRRHLNRWAQGQIALGKDSGSIIDAIVNGEQAEAGLED